MTQRVPLPENLRPEPFRVAAGLASGLSPSRLAGKDLDRPLRGVRSATPVADRLDYLRAAASRLRPWQALAGSSAAAIWGLPLPTHWRRVDAPVVVAAANDRSVPRARGFRGFRIEPARLKTVDVGGVRVTDPVTTWCLLARELQLPDLVAAADILITESRRTRRRCEPTSLDDLDEALERWRQTPGATMRRAARERVRMGVDSPMESLLRLALVDGRLPEPTVHPPVRLRNGDVVHPDLGYEWLKAGFEYEGEGHRERSQFGRDITRIEAFAEVDWLIMRVTNADLSRATDVLIRRARAMMDRAWARLRETS